MFALDLRSLAFFRIGTALVLLADLFDKARHIEVFYSDQGVLPRSIIAEYWEDYFSISIHSLSGHWYFQAIIFCFAGYFALRLLIGYRTRLTSIICWILFLSLNNRNLSIIHGGDMLLLMMLFWGMFLPWAARWSVDSLLGIKTSVKNKISSLITFALIVQVGSIYLLSGLHKTGAEWYPDFTAVYYSLSYLQYARPFGDFLLNYPMIMKFLSFFVYYFWHIIPFLLVLPFYNHIGRLIVIPIVVITQIAFGFTMELGIFPWITSVAMFALIPSWFWDKYLNKLRWNGIVKLINRFWRYLIQKRRLKLRTFHILYQNKLANFIALGTTIYILFFQLNCFGIPFGLNGKLQLPGNYLSLNYCWALFSPAPPIDNRWFIAPAIMKNGFEIDLLTSKLVNWNKPDYGNDIISEGHWICYMGEIGFYKEYDERYIWYITKEWNESHTEKEQLVSASLYTISYTTPAPNAQPDFKRLKILEYKVEEMQVIWSIHDTEEE